MKLIVNLLKLLSTKEYGVGDNIPDHSISNLDSLDVYKAKKLIGILNDLPGTKSAIKRVDLHCEKPSRS